MSSVVGKGIIGCGLEHNWVWSGALQFKQQVFLKHIIAASLLAIVTSHPFLNNIAYSHQMVLYSDITFTFSYHYETHTA